MNESDWAPKPVCSDICWLLGRKLFLITAEDDWYDVLKPNLWVPAVNSSTGVRVSPSSFFNRSYQRKLYFNDRLVARSRTDSSFRIVIKPRSDRCSQRFHTSTCCFSYSFLLPQP